MARKVIVVEGRAFDPGTGRAIGFRPGETRRGPTAPPRLEVGKEGELIVAKGEAPPKKEKPKPEPIPKKPKEGLPSIFVSPFERIAKGESVEKVLAERQALPGLVKPQPPARRAEFLPIVEAAEALPPKPRDFREAFVSTVKPVEEPKERLERIERKIAITEEKLGREKTLFPVVEAAALGFVKTAVVQPSIFAKQLITSPIKTTKETVKFLTSPTEIRRAGAKLGSRLERGEPGVFGEIAGVATFSKFAPKVVKKVKTTTLKTLPGFEKVEFISGLEATRPAELIKGTGTKKFFSITQERVSRLFPEGKLKAKEEFFKAGAGGERKAFAKKFGVKESFIFFSPEKASISFVKPIKVTEILEKTKRPRLIKLTERAQPFKESGQVQRALTGQLTRTQQSQLRATIAKEVQKGKGKLFPGTKGAAGLGTEREFVTPGTIFRERGLIPSFTIDPFGRTVRILPGTLKKTTVPKKTPTIKQRFKETPIKERIKSIREEAKVRKEFEKLPEPQKETLRRLGIKEPLRRPAISPTTRRAPITPSRRPTIPPTPRSIPIVSAKRIIAPPKEQRAITSPRETSLPIARGLAPLGEPRIIAAPGTARSIIGPTDVFAPTPPIIIKPFREREILKKPKKVKFKVPEEKIFKPSLAAVVFKIKATPAEAKAIKAGRTFAPTEIRPLAGDPISRRALGIDKPTRGGLF